MSEKEELIALFLKKLSELEFINIDLSNYATKLYITDFISNLDQKVCENLKKAIKKEIHIMETDQPRYWGFEYTDENETKHKIFITGEKEANLKIKGFVFSHIEEFKPQNGKENPLLNHIKDEETIVEQLSNGELKVSYHCDNLQDIDNLSRSEHTDYSTAKEIGYTNHGIMKYYNQREFAVGDSGRVVGEVKKIGPDALMYVSRHLFNQSFAGKCTKKIDLRRDQFDTVEAKIYDGDTNTEYNGIIPLDYQHSLREIEVDIDNIEKLKDISIPPLSKEEIDMLLAKEDPMIAEELESYYYPQRRQEYSYNYNIEKGKSK